MPVKGGKRVMDKPRLIDSDKVTQWIHDQETSCWNISSYTFMLALKDGTFAPDPIPLPTIKPGDLVRIKTTPEYGTFIAERVTARIIPTANNNVLSNILVVPIGDLEVVE
ncbi:hypothetical protein D3C87_891530 [compost metagenome]